MIFKLNYKILIVCFFCTLTIAQNIEIENISVEGLKRLDEDDIYRISKLYPGLKLSRGDEINQAINRLWEIERRIK